MEWRRFVTYLWNDPRKLQIFFRCGKFTEIFQKIFRNFPENFPHNIRTQKLVVSK